MGVRDRGFGFLKKKPDGNPLGGADDVTSPEKTTTEGKRKKEKRRRTSRQGESRWDTPLHEARKACTTTIVYNMQHNKNRGVRLACGLILERLWEKLCRSIPQIAHAAKKGGNAPPPLSPGI